MAASGRQKLLKGRFEVLEAVGEGGFARVYHARETTTGQKVALKVLKDGFQNDPEVMERFRREVFAVASIDSPHVVGLKDFGISGDEFFIAMEFVEGPTLRDVIEQMDWSADAIHGIVGQIANAIGSAHEQNIVHRDLKPENVMLVSGPNDTMFVKVLDFGLAMKTRAFPSTKKKPVLQSTKLLEHASAAALGALPQGVQRIADDVHGRIRRLARVADGRADGGQILRHAIWLCRWRRCLRSSALLCRRTSGQRRHGGWRRCLRWQLICAGRSRRWDSRGAAAGHRLSRLCIFHHRVCCLSAGRAQRRRHRCILCMWRNRRGNRAGRLVAEQGRSLRRSWLRRKRR